MIPVWNEAEGIAAVLEELRQVATADGFAVLIIDDGSSDGTPGILDSWAAKEKAWLRAMHVPHAGKDVALWKGIAQVDTEWIGVMDGDGQYDPRDLARLLEAADSSSASGAWGIRTARHDNLWRLVSSAVGKTVKTAMIGRTAIRDAGCGLFLLRKEIWERVVAACPQPKGQVHCHLAELTLACGKKVCEIPIKHRSREAGTAKFTALNRIVPGTASLLQARRARRVLKQECNCSGG